MLRKTVSLFAIVAACFTALKSNAAAATDSVALNYIYKPGDSGYTCFRIPAIITTQKGVMLAFAEARKNGCGDTGDIDLVLRRSKDGGKTWSRLQVVWNDSTNTCGNPVPIQDVTTGKIWLISTWNLGADHEKEIRTQTSQKGRCVYVLSSSDEGKSWSKAKEITSDVKKPNWTWYATGPCHGVQVANGKYKGRLVIPVNHVEAGGDVNHACTFYSDDHGTTWKLGIDTPQDGCNETTVAEISQGRLMLNMRNSDRKHRTRLTSISNDGGHTWGKVETDTLLIEPICQGSLLNYTAGKNNNFLFFINPAHSTKRANLTLRVSNNDGKTWLNSMVIHPGPAAYSDITIWKKQVACLYEGGLAKPYEGIAFKTIPLKEINKQ